MKEQSKTKKLEENQPIENAKRVSPYNTFNKIVDGRIWIITDSGLVNAAASPEKFDAALTEKVALPDRQKWPVGDREWMMRTYPDLFREIDPDDLPPDLRKQYDEITKK